jgi:hypothetical protein
MNKWINSINRAMHWYLTNGYVQAVSVAVWCAPVGFCLGLLFAGLLGANHNIQFLVATLAANVLTTIAVVESLRSQVKNNSKSSSIPTKFV